MAQVQVTEQQKEVYAAWFDEFAGEDQKLKITEVCEFYRNRGGDFSHSDICKIFKDLDEDEDKVVTKDEFMTCMCEKENMKLEIKTFFKKLDSSGDGMVTKAELKANLPKITGVAVDQEYAEQLIDGCDADGNDKITLDEFLDMMMG